MPWWTLCSEYKYTIHSFWSRWGRRRRPACSAGHQRSGYRLCLGRRPCTWHCNFNMPPVSFHRSCCVAAVRYKSPPDGVGDATISVGRHFFASAVVNNAAPVLRVLRLIWQLWASGGPRLALVVPDWMLSTRALSVPDVLCVVRPVHCQPVWHSTPVWCGL